MKFRLNLAAVATALLLAACGGGDPAITSVKVMGDSLADSGTFGYKFTVQGSAPTGAGSTAIWPELVASDVSDAGALCAYYRFNALTQAVTTQSRLFAGAKEIEALQRYEAAGVDQLIFISQAGANRHEDICESLELFAAEVMPQL